MNSKAKNAVQKIPGVRMLAAKFEKLEQEIRECRAESLALARENIDLRLRLKQMKGEKVHVVFVCHRPALWETMHGAYDALKADGHFKVTIVAVPNKKELPGTWLNHEEYASEGAEDFWKEYGCINGYNYETKEWLDLKSLEPDYVIFQQPYNVQRPPQYHSRIVSKYAKIAFQMYFAPHCYDAIYDDCAPPDFLSDLSFFFAQRPDELAHIRELMARTENDGCHLLLTGNPRFDRIGEYEGARSPVWAKNDSFKILWTPRWTTNEGNCFFFAYREALLDYARRTENTELTFRPHPQAFAEWKAMGQMTEAEERELREKLTGNLHLDESGNYYALFFSSDCLVTDKSSMIVDYLFTGKPILYCRKDHPNGDLIPELEKGVYPVYNLEELTRKLEELRGGEDPKKEERERIRQEYLQVKGEKASELIRKALLEDAVKGV